MAVGVSGVVMLVGLQRDVGALHRDVAGLRERMAKLEGAVDGFMRGVVAHHIIVAGGAQRVSSSPMLAAPAPKDVISMNRAAAPGLPCDTSRDTLWSSS